MVKGLDPFQNFSHLFCLKYLYMIGFKKLRNILKPLKNYTNGLKVLRGFERFENVTKLEVSKGYFQGMILSFLRFVQVSETLKPLETIH